MNTTDEKDKVTEAVFARILREGITPRPRWQFLLRESVIWGAGGFSVAIGAIAVAAVLFELRNAWWDAYEATHDNLLTFTFDALPFVWVACLVVFTGLIYASIRYTKRGYRHTIQSIVLISMGLSAAGGVTAYLIGGGQFADEQVGSMMPFHRSLIMRERMMWTEPEKGRVAGIVRNIPLEENAVWVEDLDGDEYRIDTTDFDADDRLLVHVGEQIRILGIPTTTPHVLHGCIIFEKANDVLRRAYAHPPLGIAEDQKHHERITLTARSIECKGLRPFAYFAPKE